MLRMMIAGALVALGALLGAGEADAATSECRVYTSAPNFVGGTVQTLPCSADGLRVVNGSPGTDQDVNLVTVGGVPIALGQTTMSASIPVAIASDQSVLPVGGNIASGSADSGNPVKVGGKYNVTLPTFADGQRGDAQIGTRGSLNVQNMLPNSTVSQTGATTGSDTVSNTINALNVQAFGLLWDGTQWVRMPGTTVGAYTTLRANTTGGCTPGKTLSAASTNSTSIKASAAGTLCSLTVINTNAALYYLKLYDTAAAPTCNSSTVIQTIPVPASTTGAGVSVDVGPYAWAFANGIGFCLTGALADNDNTNAATGVAISYSYK